MLQFIIRLLEKFLVYLKNIEEKNMAEISREGGSNTSILSKIALWIGFLIPMGAFGIMLYAFIFSFFDFHTLGKVVSCFVATAILLIMFIHIVDNFSKKYLHLVFFPGILGLIIFILGSYFVISGVLQFNEIPYYLALGAIFPLMYILGEKKYKFTQKDVYKKIKTVFFNYNLFLYFIFSFYVTLAIFGIQLPFLEEISEFIKSIFGFRGYSYSYNFLEDLFTIGIIFFSHFVIIYFPLAGLHTYFDIQNHCKKSFAKGWLIFVIFQIIFFVIYFIPEWKQNYFSDYINKTHQIIQSQGFNAQSLEKSNLFILERAFLSDIKNGYFSQKNRELFQKIFDTTPEKFYGEDVADYFNNSRSFATNISKTGENADVIFELAEIQNKIDTEEKILETSYEFYFQNTTQTSQEVIINFEAPSHNSVVSELYLGLNDELVGQIAPRGAARRVYEDSLRRNTDPALIEKIGFSSYNLRIFPIPAKNIHQGKQKVLVKMLTPLDNAELKISPKFSLINLKFDKNSRYISKTYKDEELSSEEILEGKKDITEKTSQDNYQNLGDIQISEVPENSVCLAQDFQNILEDQNIPLENKKELGKQIHIFFDNSQSIENNNAQKYYDEIYQSIKNYDNSLQDTKLYSFNFMVERQVKIQDIDFWGYSDIDKLIKFIADKQLTNTNIVFVTDDDNFNISSLQNNNFYNTNITSNRFSIIKIGNNIKHYKSEIQSLLSQTNGNIYEINSQEEIPQTVEKIFSYTKTHIYKTCDDQEDKENEEVIISDNWKRIQAGYISQRILESMENPQDLQNKLAEKYTIVNQFNSYIALETQEQQNDLDRYSDGEGKYDTKFDTGISSGGITNRRVGGPVTFGNLDNSIRSDSLSSVNVSFGMDKTSINGEGSGRYNNRSIEVSFLGFLLILMYLAQIMGMVSFFMKLFKRKN